MSIRRFVQIVAFLSALALSFAVPVSGAEAGGCPPSGSGGLC
jgi:hypothetical protein